MCCLPSVWDCLKIGALQLCGLLLLLLLGGLLWWLTTLPVNPPAQKETTRVVYL